MYSRQYEALPPLHKQALQWFARLHLRAAKRNGDEQALNDPIAFLTQRCNEFAHSPTIIGDAYKQYINPHIRAEAEAMYLPDAEEIIATNDDAFTRLKPPQKFAVAWYAALKFKEMMHKDGRSVWPERERHLLELRNGFASDADKVAEICKLYDDPAARKETEEKYQGDILFRDKFRPAPNGDQSQGYNR